MKPRSHHPAKILIVAFLLFLYGCSSPTLTDTKEDKGRPATTTIANVTPPVTPATPPPPVHQMLAAEAVAQKGKVAMPINVRKNEALVQAPAALGAMVAPSPMSGVMQDSAVIARQPYPKLESESYNALGENPLVVTQTSPLSTFSIDVDTASYSNLRRILTSGTLPPPGAVRVEEMINYFTYAYPQPETGPIGITTELGPCPWRPENKLVRIGLKAKDLDAKEIPPSNLVFLVDVSGSMNHPNKLPLLQQSMVMLVDQLTARDRIGIVVYAGSDRVVLTPTAGDKQAEIKAAINSLVSGGSTHASKGINTAYALARQHFMPGANNRVILASDGDFNVGVTSRDELERLIVKERESGVFLTVLGFGMGNYKDDTMEILADKGNGNYSYIDSLLEARKVLVKERTANLFTLAKDVKLQIEFNPALVGAYRLIGYENRVLANEDFHDDKKDAGEIGVGHTVTALYELYPPGSPAIPKVDSFKYQAVAAAPGNSTEIMTVKLRYKPMGSNDSTLISKPVIKDNLTLAQTSDDFRFASAVAGYGTLLRHPADAPAGLTFAMLLDLAKNSRGKDQEGYRAEFIRLLETGEMLSKYPRQQPTN